MIFLAPLEPGTAVRHVSFRPAEHDDWRGIILSRYPDDAQPESWSAAYKVRWIKPDGDVSQASNVCERFELVPMPTSEAAR